MPHCGFALLWLALPVSRKLRAAAHKLCSQRSARINSNSSTTSRPRIVGSGGSICDQLCPPPSHLKVRAGATQRRMGSAAMALATIKCLVEGNRELACKRSRAELAWPTPTPSLRHSGAATRRGDALLSQRDYRCRPLQRRLQPVLKTSTKTAKPSVQSQPSSNR